MSSTLLIVDDAPENLGVLTALLQSHHRVRAATSGAKALAIARSQPRPDLILLDLMMPGMDGHEVFSELRQDPLTADIPVIFVTACDDPQAEIKGLAEGAADYIAKPIIPALLLARVRAHLELKQARDRLADQHAWLEAEIARRMRENEPTERVSFPALAHLAETRDMKTGNHRRRIQAYVQALVEHLKSHPRFRDMLTPRFIELLTRSAPLHDIGKVGIGDAILSEPGPLTGQEGGRMQIHARLEVETIELAEGEVDPPESFQSIARHAALGHHERWDGSGYPQGLAGDEIPLAARLLALTEVFDALTSRRVYKPAMSYEAAREIIRQERGKRFDPDIADAFDALFENLVTIAKHHRDVE